MAARTQDESEQPAKVYQLDAVDRKVDDINGKLDTLLQQTTGLVTTNQLSQTERELRDKIKEEVDKIHLEYGPMKKDLKWFLRAAVAEALLIAGELVSLYLISKKP
jgi:hypothetical protein